MGKMEEISAWNLTKVRSRKKVIDEAKTKGAKISETEFWCSRCIRQGGVEVLALALWRSNVCFGKLKKSGKPHNTENVLLGMVWADIHWLFGDNTQIFIHIWNVMIWTWMEPKPESLWWTHTQVSDLLFDELFVLVCRFHRDGKGFQSTERDHVQSLEKLVV